MIIKITPTKLDLPNYKKILNKRIFDQISKNTKSNIVNRTKSGLDVNQSMFLPYAKSNKKKYGKSVDLSDTGRMLNDISYASQDGLGQIFFRSSRSSNIAGYNENRSGYQRKFFGLSKKDILKIRQKIIEILRRVK